MMQNEIAVGYRLSPQQKRIWKLLEADPRAPYRSVVALSIKGMLNEARLTDALREVVNRHEILRTNYPVPHGMSLPLQTISEAGPVYMEADLSDLPEPQRSIKLERLFEEEKRRPLDFKDGENLRATLVRLSPTSNVLLINVPAITSDEAGLDNLIAEIISLYQDPQAGAALQEPLQYADYSEWQNQLLEAEETRAGRDYWRRAEFRNPASLKLPFENRLAPESGFAPAVLSKTIEPEVLGGIEALAARAEASVASVLLAGWHALLWRLTDDDGIIVGACYEGRRFDGLGDAVGLFEKYLPIRCRLDDQQEFLDVVKSVDESARDVELWQENFAWENLSDFQEEGEEKSFFPFLFDFKEERLERSSGDLDFSIYRRYSCADRSRVRLSCRREQGKLILDFHYDSASISDESARRLAGRFETLMQSAVRNPLSKVTRLNLMSLSESREIAEWNRTEIDFPRGACAHELFEQQARQTPDAIALEFQGETLTYRELDERANRLANYFVGFGVGPEVIVGVCLERSFDLIVGLFGILKAGGAYLPLDSAYPNQRLAYMAKDAGIRVLLTQSTLLDTFSHLDSHTLCLDSSREMIDSLSPIKPDSGARPHNLAYVIYTSGSTGNPKGVMIHHSALVNYLCWCSHAYSASEGIESILHSPVGFDLSVTSLHAPLAWGGKVVLVDEADGLQGLSEALKRPASKRLVKLTPAHLEVLARAGAGNIGRDEEAIVVVGGEALMGESLKGWSSTEGRIRVINEYGPTETVVGCCVYEVKQGEEIRGSVEIGRAIDNARMYVLDGRQEAVGVGVVGEIYVGGEGVGRGYLGRAEQTAERFVPDPYAGEAGVRMYRTGDLGRYKEDGSIEYIGRNDRQVKVRGYRVEPGEVEEEMRRMRGVREAAVEVRENERGEKELVGYVVLEGEERGEEEVREEMRRRVPEYMVPGVVVRMERMPLTHNGKIDRRALPNPAQARAKSRSPFVAPQTEIEQAIAAIWRQALHVEEVGLNDNFFDLGGGSLVMFVVYSQLKTMFLDDPSVQALTMVDMFQYPTVGSLARHLTEHQREQPSFELAQDRAAKQRAVRDRQGRAVRARRGSNE